MEHLEAGRQWLTQLLSLSGIPLRVEVEERRIGDATEEEALVWLIADSSQLTAIEVETLIGEGGANLDALQYLANAALNLGAEAAEDHRFYIVELGGYRRQQQDNLTRIADEAADMVRRTGEDVRIANLSASERRQLHMLLKAEGDLETFSEGKEPHRRLVVRRIAVS